MKLFVSIFAVALVGAGAFMTIMAAFEIHRAAGYAVCGILLIGTASKLEKQIEK